jgi:hypothetical protein
LRRGGGGGEGVKEGMVGGGGVGGWERMLLPCTLQLDIRLHFELNKAAHNLICSFFWNHFMSFSHLYLGLASGPFFKFSTQIMYAFPLYMLSLLHVFLFHVSENMILVILHESCRFCVSIFRLGVCKFNTHTKQ